MRILLAQNSLYYPAHGGGDKSNRLLLEALAARGHECRVVARISVFGEPEEARYLEDLAARGVTGRSTGGGVVTFERGRVEVHVVTNANLRACFAAQVDAFRPDVILVSTDDPAQLLLDVALRDAAARVVYLARATLALPFGPDCAFPSEAKTQRIRAADAVVGVSRYVADYIRKYAGIDAVHVPISLMEPEDWPELARFDNEFVTLVNPCAVKGHRDISGAGRRVPRHPVRRRADVGHQPAGPRGAGSAGECEPARAGGRYQPAAGADACAAGALPVGGGAVAHCSGGDAARRAGDGERRGRHSGSQNGRTLPAAGEPDREV